MVLMAEQVNDGRAAYSIRAAALAAGYPNTTAASSVNRFCSSGLKAVQDIADQIGCGSIDIGLAVGAESMSAGGGSPGKPFHPDILKAQEAVDCMQPMGQTSENVGKDFNISRESQDRYAAESFQRAERAQKAGWFADEIVPITTEIKDPKTGEVKEVTLTKDEGPRWGTTFESLQKVRPAFPQFGDKSTGGNSSQVTDGGTFDLISPSLPILILALTLFSRRYPFDEALSCSAAQPAHSCQILRCNRHWSCAPHHGYWPIYRYPQAARQTPFDQGRH